MIIAEHIKEMSTNCPLPTQNFSIKASPVAFDILSSRLYSNPILAIIRELLTNAYDSHKAAGTLDKPIHIQLPDYITDNFIIRDYGVGLSKEDILTIYTTFFDSTKATTNDFTGCFGLGSKTPFSYTNSFSINSYFNGYKHSFIAIKKEGYPAIISVKDEPTTEPNGLEINIPIKSNSDKCEFTLRFNEYLKYIPEILVDVDVIREAPTNTIDNIKIYARDNKVKIEHKTTLLRSVFIKQGCNIYNIYNILYNNIHNISNTFPYVSAISGWNDIYIEIPIGTLAITPSRESLSSDSSNLDIIKSILKDVDTKLGKYITNITIEDKDLNNAILDAKNQVLSDKYFGYCKNIEVTFEREYNILLGNRRKAYFRDNDLSLGTLTSAVSAKIQYNFSIYEGNALVILKPRNTKFPILRKLGNIITNYPDVFGKYDSIHVLEFPRINSVVSVPSGSVSHYTTYYNNIPLFKYMREFYSLIWTLNNIPNMNFNIEITSLSKMLRNYKNTKGVKIPKTTDLINDEKVQGTQIRLATCEIHYAGGNKYAYHNHSRQSHIYSVRYIQDHFLRANTVFIGLGSDEKNLTFSVLAALTNLKTKDNTSIISSFVYSKAKEQVLENILYEDKKIKFCLISKSNIKYFENYVCTTLKELHSYLMSLDPIVVATGTIPEEIPNVLSTIPNLIRDSYPKKVQDIIFNSKNYQKLLKVYHMSERYKDIPKYSHIGFGSPVIQRVLFDNFNMPNIRVYDLTVYIPKDVAIFCDKMKAYMCTMFYSHTKYKHHSEYNYLDRKGKTYLLQYLLTNNL